MKRAVIALFGLALLTGCGGAGDTAFLPSLYKGSWTGTWASGDANDNGNISFAVTTDGSLSGTMADKTGATGNIAGFVNKSGSLTAVTSFAAGGNMVIGGTVTTNGGRLIGSFTYTRLGVNYGGNFDVGTGSSGGG
jgi:hypothetical protein